MKIWSPTKSDRSGLLVRNAPKIQEAVSLQTVHPAAAAAHKAFELVCSIAFRTEINKISHLEAKANCYNF
eukprot:SAG11_NODE_863_length_6839_cov_4.857418_5_plen_70_part_00